MTWLSEIEEKNDKLGALFGNKGMVEIKRMARVIRELVEVAKIADEVPSNAAASVRYRNRLHKALDNLSPDAKDLL